MKTVTIRELHAKTGEWVRQARRHGEIVVTDNGRPIAKIVPEERVEIPYFARRQPSPGFAKLDASAGTGLGTDATKLIADAMDSKHGPRA